jgi:hypothetical protein
MIARIVFILCALTSLLCAILLLRGYVRRAVPLLLWSGLCFVCFSVSNLILLLDQVVFRSVDLTPGHMGATLVGLGLLLYGLIWDT